MSLLICNTEREKRSYLRRILKAWKRDAKRTGFIARWLARKGYPVDKMLCLQANTNYIIKELTPIAGGAIALVYGCTRCGNANKSFEELHARQSQNIDQTELFKKAFSGVCMKSRNVALGDVNRILILPQWNQQLKVKCPFQLIAHEQTVKIGNKVHSRLAFRIQ